jgi:hypothetical protein
MNALTENVKHLQKLNKDLKKTKKQLISNLKKLDIKNSEINKYKEQFLIDLKQDNIELSEIYIPEITTLLNNIKNLDIDTTIDINQHEKQYKKHYINIKTNFIKHWYSPKYGPSYVLNIKFNENEKVENIILQKINI